MYTRILASAPLPPPPLEEGTTVEQASFAVGRGIRGERERERESETDGGLDRDKETEKKTERGRKREKKKA